MTPRDDRPLPATPVYDQALMALVRAAEAELAAARDRLATPAEIAPLQHRLAALREMRPGR